MKKAAKISLITLAAAVPAVGIATTVALIFTKKNSGTVVVTEEDKKLVDNINTAISGKTYSTMSDLLDALSSEGYNLLTQQIQTNGVQFVWDSKVNDEGSQTIFLMKNDGSVAYAPNGYVLNTNESQLWRMVKAGNSIQLSSASNLTDAVINTFDSNAKYSQYLRDGFSSSTPLTFCSGLDVGNNEQLKLNFKKDETSVTPIVINTTKSSLTIESKSNIQHYGNLTDLTVNLKDVEGNKTTLEEYGTVDANVTIESGKIETKEGSQINTIIVKTDDVNDVKIDVASGSSIGTIGSTDADIAAKLEDEVISGETEGTVGEIKENEAIEEPDPDPEAEFYSGDGTENSPWVINSKQQLLNFVEKFNDEEEYSTREGKFYCNLINNIDMTGETWTPLGTSDKPFKGCFNGCGFAINNLTIAQTSDGQRMGMFAYTSGDVNTQYKVTTTTSGSTVSAWDDENNEIKLDLVKEDLYTTSIKNLYFNKVTSVSEKTETVTDPRYVAAVIGDAANTYISNVHVNSGTIKCGKGAGGIAGTLQGCIVTDCTTGTFEATGENQLTITATEYNAGGIAGGCAYGTAATNASCDAFINCTNHANISGLNTSANGGFNGGIVGYNQQADASYGTNLFQDCLNTGEIYAKTGSASGIGMAGRAWAFNRCSNTGLIHCSDDEKSTTGKPRYSLAGITLYGIAKCVDCSNYGKISGYTEYMAGIFGESASGKLDNIGIENCTNTGELVSSNSNCIVANIATGERTVVIKGGTYATVADLNSELSGKISSISAITVELVGVTVTDKTGTLSFPSAISSFVSDNPVASSMDFIGKNGTVVIDVPNMNINVSSDCSQTTIMNYSDNSTLTIAQGASCNNAVAVGADSKIINNGTILGSMSIDGNATYGENSETGTCSSVTFGYIKFRIGHGAKHLVNKGVIKTTASEGNQHVLYSIGGSDCSITIDNYNTIEYYAAPEISGASGYLFLLNNINTTNNVINCYAESKLITSFASGSRFSLATNTDLYYQSGAEFKAGGQTIEWGTLSSGKLSVHQMQ